MSIQYYARSASAALFLPGVACIYMRNDNGNNMTANIITVRQCNMLQLI